MYRPQIEPRWLQEAPRGAMVVALGAEIKLMFVLFSRLRFASFTYGKTASLLSLNQIF